jgi:hypothetical protein
MSPSRQEELTQLLDRVLGLPAVKSMNPEARLARVHHDWLEAGDAAQRTVARLSSQLRRFLDDQAFLENRRIMQIIREVEQHALSLRETLPTGDFFDVEALSPSIEIPMTRPLFTPPLKPDVTSTGIEDGADVEDTVDSSALFEQTYVDKTRLALNLRRALQTRAQVSLAELIESSPIESGLAELVTYVSMASADRTHVIDDDQRQTVSWIDRDGVVRAATIPLVIFQRATS